MKKITIDGKEYDIDCNAYTQIEYKSKFKSGIIQDMQIIKKYLLKQTIVSNQVNELDLDEVEKINEISDRMSEDIDEFIIKLTQLTWILLYTANDKIEDYKEWLKSIQKLDILDDWIVEVTEFAVDCFC